MKTDNLKLLQTIFGCPAAPFAKTGGIDHYAAKDSQYAPILLILHDSETDRFAIIPWQYAKDDRLSPSDARGLLDAVNAEVAA